MKNRITLAAAILTLTIAGCESSSSSTPPGRTGDGGTFPSDGGGGSDAGGGEDAGGGGGTTGCSITLSGAVSKTVPCTISAGYDRSSGQAGIPIQSTTSLVQGAAEATFAMHVNGELTPKTYAWADTIDQGGAVLESVTDAWTVSQKDMQGTSSTTLTSVMTTADDGTVKLYAVHGTVTATLVPKGNAMGTITMSVTF